MISILFLLAIGTFSTQYTVNNVTFYIDNIATTSIYSSDGSEKCNKIVLKTNQLYHLSSEGAYQSWPKSTLTPQTSIVTSVQSGYTVHDMGVSDTEQRVTFVTSHSTSGRLVDTLNGDQTINSQAVFSNPYEGTNVATDGTYDYVLAVDTVVTSATHIYVMQGNTIIHDYPISVAFTRMAVSPDFQRAVVWQERTQFMIVNLLTGTNSTVFAVPVIPAINSTKKITFSQDSTLALVESDSYNPIIVIDIVNEALSSLIVITDTIYEAHFINSSNDYVVVLGQANMVLVDIPNDLKYPLPTMQDTAYGSNYENTIYTCTANIISQQRIANSPIVITPTNQSQPTSTSQESVEKSFYVVVSPIIGQLFGVIDTTLSGSSGATTMVTTLASSLPIGIYFLSFINYFSLCSLYILLNFPIPQQIYVYLVSVYEQLNQNLFAIFGVEINIGPFSDERSNTDRSTFFGITSDMASSNTTAFIILGANIALIFLLNYFFSFCRRNNPMRVMVSNQKWNMIFGNIINIILPITLPWTFFFLQSGVRNVGTKVNSVFYLIFYFVGIVFPIYYFFDLLHDRERLLIKERREGQKHDIANKQKKNIVINYSRDMSKFQTQGKYEEIKSISDKKVFFDQRESLQTDVSRGEPTINHPQPKERFEGKYYVIRESALQNLKKRQGHNPKIIEQSKGILKHFKLQLILEGNEQDQSQRHPELQKRSKISIKKLITIDIIQQWYLCQANFIYPSFVLLSSPIYFLVIVQLFTLLGTIIGFKKKELRINSFLLSLYPLLFHTCFIVFYCTTSLNVLAITETVCLGIFTIGVIHQCLTVGYELAVFIFNCCKMLCKKKTNEILPLNQKKNKLQKPKKEKKIRKAAQISFLKPPHIKMMIKKPQDQRESKQLHIRQSITGANKLINPHQ